MRIAVLPPEIAAQIAAGEVIERPASAVKELVENALDAGARSVSVEIERGGVRLVRVVDDGCGMTAEELALAVGRHATSKLRRVEDLRAVRTFGFRGEALPSLAAAGELTIESRPHDAASGALLEVRGGQLRPVRPAGTPPGTRVTLEDLFGRQPARRAFLRAPATETARVAAVLTAAVLARPDVRFNLTVDGRRTLNTSGSGELLDVAARVFGRSAAAQLLPLAGEARGGLRVTGLISTPALSRPTRTGITLYVNGRAVQGGRLTYAAAQAYATLLPGGRYPVAVIFVELPPEEVDVNVHPAKAEVRFRDERAVAAAVHEAVRGALLASMPVPALSVPGIDLATGELTGNTDALDGAPSVALASDTPLAAPMLWAPLVQPREPAPLTPLKPRMPPLRVVGQVGTTYVVAEGPDGMYLIDQHAAHERVLYERLLAERAARTPAQQALLQPATLELSAAQVAVLAEALPALEPLGLMLEPFGERAALLRAVPAVLAKRDPAAAVLGLLDALIDPEAATLPGMDRAVATVACHAAVRAGMTLSGDEMRELALLLEACESPRTCPHGRPTMMHLSAAALDREFRRA